MERAAMIEHLLASDSIGYVEAFTIVDTAGGVAFRTRQ